MIAQTGLHSAVGRVEEGAQQGQLAADKTGLPDSRARQIPCLERAHRGWHRRTSPLLAHLISLIIRAPAAARYDWHARQGCGARAYLHLQAQTGHQASSDRA